MIVLYVFGIAYATWLTGCAVIWICWFVFGGHKNDHSGDATLGILFLPVFPFIWVRRKVLDLIKGR